MKKEFIVTLFCYDTTLSEFLYPINSCFRKKKLNLRNSKNVVAEIVFWTLIVKVVFAFLVIEKNSP